MKKYLKVEEGSRGEIESVDFVETSYELIKEDFDKYVEGLKEDEELDLGYIEEFTYCEEEQEKGLILVAFGEEEGCTYIEYEMYKERIDEALRNGDDESLLYDLLDEVRD